MFYRCTTESRHYLLFIKKFEGSVFSLDCSPSRWMAVFVSITFIGKDGMENHIMCTLKKSHGVTLADATWDIPYWEDHGSYNIWRFNGGTGTTVKWNLPNMNKTFPFTVINSRDMKLP